MRLPSRRAALRAAGQSVLTGLVLLSTGFGSRAAFAASQWADYFMPTPILSPLSSICWGAKQVGPRDQSNGLEDKTLANWQYWDGGIIKDDQTGVYHMFASRWNQADGLNGWQFDSHCVHATSTSLYGPYQDQGQCFTDNDGLCHNVNPLKLKATDSSGKQYAITCSGGVPGSGRAYGADSLNGPWSYLGDIQLDLNGYSGEYSTADNFRTILRPDGQYECMNSRIGLADNVLGPYKAQMANDFVNSVPNSPTVNMEDPFIFYLGGLYHVIYHCWSTGVAYLYTSEDGIHGWSLNSGVAYDPSTNMVRYTDGTVNHWPLLERASVYIENGQALAMTFAAINVQKADDKGNDGNGSKVIVVPFDGLDFVSGAPAGSSGVGGGGGNGGAAGRAGTGGGGAGSASGAAGRTAGTGGGGGMAGVGARESADGSAGAPLGGTAGDGEAGRGGSPGAGGGGRSSGGSSGSGGLAVRGADVSTGSSGCTCSAPARGESSPWALLLLVGSAWSIGRLRGRRRADCSPQLDPLKRTPNRRFPHLNAAPSSGCSKAHRVVENDGARRVPRPTAPSRSDCSHSVVKVFRQPSATDRENG